MKQDKTVDRWIRQEKLREQRRLDLYLSIVCPVYTSEKKHLTIH